MKRNDDDQPEKKENQGRSTKNQTTLTRDQVKGVVDAGLNPIVTRLAKLETGIHNLVEALGSKGSVTTVLAEIKQLAADTSGYAKDASTHALKSKDLTVELDGKLQAMTDADEHRETRIGLMITEASSQAGVEQLNGQVAQLTSTLEHQGADSAGRHTEVLGRFDALDRAVLESHEDIKRNSVKLDGVVMQITEVANQAAGLASQLDHVIQEGKKLKRRAFTIREHIGAVRNLIVSDGAMTRDNFAGAMSAATEYLAGEMGDLGTSLVEIHGQIVSLPDNLGKDLAGKLSKMINLADKIANGGELIAEHMENMGRSTSEAFRLHKHMLTAIESESRGVGDRLIEEITDASRIMVTETTKTFNAIEKKVQRSFAKIDPDGHLDRLSEISEAQWERVEAFESLAKDLLEARDDMVAKNGILAAATKSEFSRVLAAFDAIAPQADKLIEHFSHMAAGYKSAEETGVALNNRIIAMGIEAYKRDVENMKAEKDQARQDDREYLVNELRGMIKPLIGEAISQELKGWLEGQLDVVEQAGTDQA